MSTYIATIRWALQQGAPFTDLKYSRAHLWEFDGGLSLPASSSPHHVPLPWSDPVAVDPEEAYVAAISSCHMLFFLYFAARRRFIVSAYRDRATGLMGRDENGREYVTHITLAPTITFEAGENMPDDADVHALHHEAHEGCYLANSVKTVIDVAGSWDVRTEATSVP